IGLPRHLVRPVTLEALVRKNRADVAVEDGRLAIGCQSNRLAAQHRHNRRHRSKDLPAAPPPLRKGGQGGSLSKWSHVKLKIRKCKLQISPTSSYTNCQFNR